MHSCLHVVKMEDKNYTIYEYFGGDAIKLQLTYHAWDGTLFDRIDVATVNKTISMNGSKKVFK